MDFKEVKIKDISTILNGRAYKQNELLEYGKYKILRVGNFFTSDKWYFSDMELEENKYCDYGDLLFAWSANFGPKIWNEGKTIYHYHIWKFELKENVDKNYLYYYLKFITNKLKNSTHGSVMLHLTKSDMENQIIKIPNYSNQMKIGTILSKIDDKIELNNKINDNLFKFAISYINNKIEETEVPISKFAKIQGGYAFKSKDLLDDKTNNRIIKIKNLRSEINADVVNSQYVEDEVANSIDSKFKLNKGDVTIAMTGAELGKTGLIYGFDNYYLNQRVGVIRGKNKEGELYLKILFLSNEFQTLLNSKGYGSAQPNISTNDIESILINDIAEENLKDIYERLNSVYYRIISNCEENLNLEQLRETLLPKLMNGEIDLDKIEI